MALNKSYNVSIGALTASAFGSTTHEAFLSLAPRDFNAAASIKWDSLTGNGNLIAQIDFAAESAPNAQWTNSLAFSGMSASSMVNHAFYSSSDDQVKPLLPNARVRVTNRSTDANSSTYTNIVLKLLVES
jgi:hypothetical protein